MNSPYLIQGLIDKGFSYLGMINEAKSKCLILKDKIKRLDEKPEFLEETTSEILCQMLQIRKDINKYSEKLMGISKALRENGAIQHLG